MLNKSPKSARSSYLIAAPWNGAKTTSFDPIGASYAIQHLFSGLVESRNYFAPDLALVPYYGI